MKDRLSSVIGMVNLKGALSDYLDDSLADNLRRRMELNTGFKRPVVVFSGNPGTGKTSVAALVAGLFFYFLSQLSTAVVSFIDCFYC